MKKSLLGIFLASVMVQPVMAGLVPVADVKLDGDCYKFSLVDTSKIVPAISSQCTGKIVQVKVLYRTRLVRDYNGAKRSSIVYTVLDDTNTMRQIRVPYIPL